MEGPILKELERLLQAARHDTAGVSATAIVNDAFVGLGLSPLSDAEAASFCGPPLSEWDLSAKGDAGLLKLACVPLAHPFFSAWAEEGLAKGEDRRATLLSALRGAVEKRAGKGPLVRFVAEAEGREELCRALLQGIGAAPRGETAKTARDRFAAVDTVERARVLAKAKAAEDRARALREAMERREAEEAASKMSRE